MYIYPDWLSLIAGYTNFGIIEWIDNFFVIFNRIIIVLFESRIKYINKHVSLGIGLPIGISVWAQSKFLTHIGIAGNSLPE